MQHTAALIASACHFSAPNAWFLYIRRPHYIGYRSVTLVNLYRQDSLRSIGLRIQLGHNVAETCSLPVKAKLNNKFVIVDSDQIHEVALDFCGCHMTKPFVEQLLEKLLEKRLFPATNIHP